MAVEDYKDGLAYNECAERLGVEPIEGAEIERRKSLHDAAVNQFGTEFTKDWGWAAPLSGGKAPTFRTLEKQSGLDHLRPHYRHASHVLHAGSTGTNLVFVGQGDDRVMLAGPSNEGLADPGHGSLISLGQVTTTLLLKSREADLDPETVMTARALQHLVGAAGDAFEEAHIEHERVAERLRELKKSSRRRPRARWTIHMAKRRAVRLLRGIWRAGRSGTHVQARDVRSRLRQRFGDADPES